MSFVSRLTRRVKHALDPISEVESYANTEQDRDRRTPELKHIDAVRADRDQALAHTNTYRLTFAQHRGRSEIVALDAPCPHLTPDNASPVLAAITRKLDAYAQSIGYRRRIRATLNIGRQETDTVPHVTCYVDLGKLPLPKSPRDSEAFNELMAALLASSDSLPAHRCPIC